MDSSGRTCADLVELIKSWIHWQPEPVHVSRDFWMPDESCRVCYECDSQFTLLNRRHHCRLCGRIFCGKCTSNWIPAPSCEHKIYLEDWEKIRVCNYCFKQWEQNLALSADNGIRVANLDLISTPSATSSVISKSSGTCDHSSVTFVSLSQSAGLSPIQSTLMETEIESQSVAVVTSVDRAVDIGEQNHSLKQYRFCPPSYDEDEEFGESHLESKTNQYSPVTSYINDAKFDDIDDGYGSRKVHPGGDAADSQNINNSSVRNSFDSQVLDAIQQIVQKSDDNDVSEECEAPSSIYVASDVESDPVDFENNGVIWLPPEPEDEEDEREALLFDDDDDGDAAGEWGYLRNSSSFGSGEYRNRDKSNEVHKKAMKSVVDIHFRSLVAQLLQMENLLSEDENDKENWLEIITALSWEAATLLKPDTSKSGQMDPGNYVKVKCLASGQRSDSMVIKGVVCKKNVAHRRMMSKIEKPRVLILGGALEYQRVSNALSSFDTLLQQEMDHLKMAVAKIDAHHPDILLVEKSVSRHAQEYLLAKDISLVLNIKKPLLERLARCTGGQIVPSIDHLSSHKLGYCEMFHVEKFFEEHGSAGQDGKKLTKTLMYFEGCPKPLGCTILLRGANGDELKKVKHVVQYGIFAAYHLALETSFLADEGASLPEFPLNNPITVALPDKPSKIDRSISTIPGFTIPDNEKTPGPQSVGEPQRSRSAPPADLVKATEASIFRNEHAETSNLLASVTNHKIPTSSSDESFQFPTLNVRSPSSSLQVANLQHSAVSVEVETFEAGNLTASGDHHIDKGFENSNVKITQNDSHDSDANINGPNLSLSQLEEKQNLEEKSSLKDEFPPSPSDHQSILVSLSSRCVWKGTVCERSHLFRIKYYGNFDKPLGRFLRDNLFDQNYSCHSCEMPAEAHIQCYTHRQGTLTISVKKLSEVLLPGEKDGKIWMWHRCLKCPRVNGFPPATRRVVMSDAAWGLSFGKFLELSFSNHAAASRTASCGHSLHRDCLRFYGFGKMVACFRYASIDVHSVYLPPSQLDFNCERQEWTEKELNEVMNRAELLFSEVLNALHMVERRSIAVGGTKSPQSRRQIADLEDMLQKEKLEFEESLQMIMKQGPMKGKPAIDILELNRLRRQLVFQSYMWDCRLVYADSLEENSQLDDISITSSESCKQTAAAPENLSDVNDSFKAGETLSDSGSFAAYAKLSKTPEEGVIHIHSGQCNEVLSQRNGVPDSNFEDKTSLSLSVGPKAMADFDTVGSDITNGTVLSDGPTSICLSDTLDAAWTGENHPGLEITNKHRSESAEADILSTVGVAEKSDIEDRSKDVSTFLSSDYRGDTSWLGLTFMSFYRSLNKNLLGTAQKLDKICEYDPIYVSLFRESKLQGGPRFFLPVGENDIVVPVYDDEPTSIISYALASPDYLAQLSDELERPRDITDSFISMQSFDAGNLRSFHSMDEIMLESSRTLGYGDESVLSLTSSRSSLPPLDPLSYSKALHPRVSFENDGPLGKVKYAVTCYYAKRFEALRRICCPSEVDFIRSLSRCKKWGAQGGKSNVFFAKTLDDRFIIKQVTKTELESFIKFAPGYFKYLSESIGTGSPTCLAKILGIYQVAVKHLKGGKESKIDLLVMENLLFGRNITRLYDLKGSSRSRYNPDSSGSNKVLLDQNLIESMPTSPIFVGNKAKRLLERAIWNDTAFLASIDVMDYSLLVGIDEEKHELVVGIIDFMRQYTWDKHLETWVKASGILGGNTSASPTVISPKQYKKRFRKAMTTYFLMVPDQWSPPTIIPSKSQTDLLEENNKESSSNAE